RPGALHPERCRADLRRDHHRLPVRAPRCPAPIWVMPDLATFGKAIANGFSVSALVGRRDLMEQGGLRHDKERVFLLSTTHGGETHQIAAALATLRELEHNDVATHVWNVGAKLVAGSEGLVRELGMA